MSSLFLSSDITLFATEQNVKNKQIEKAFVSVNSSFVTRKYILGPNDVLNISVWGMPEFEQKEILVQPDGNIILAPVGVIEVAGKTLTELHDILLQAYSKYLVDPHITVDLDQTKPFIVYVSGAVLNPGSYEIDTDTKKSQFIDNSKPELRIIRKTPLLSNILVAAGGISYDADIENIQIFNEYENVSFHINLFDLIANGNSHQDLYLMSGDVIKVPRLPTPLAIDENKYKVYAPSTMSPNTIQVKVFGYVNNPGLKSLNAATSLNLNSAIMQAGGYIKDAAYPNRKIYLCRIDNNGKLVTRKVNPMEKDLVLMPNDIIYVPDKPRPIVGKVFDYLLRIIVPAQTFANAYNEWALMFDPKRFKVVAN